MKLYSLVPDDFELCLNLIVLPSLSIQCFARRLPFGQIPAYPSPTFLDLQPDQLLSSQVAIHQLLNLPRASCAVQ